MFDISLAVTTKIKCSVFHTFAHLFSLVVLVIFEGKNKPVLGHVQPLYLQTI